MTADRNLAWSSGLSTSRTHPSSPCTVIRPLLTENHAAPVLQHQLIALGSRKETNANKAMCEVECSDALEICSRGVASVKNRRMTRTFCGCYCLACSQWRPFFHRMRQGETRRSQPSQGSHDLHLCTKSMKMLGLARLYRNRPHRALWRTRGHKQKEPKS
jgi:hypothetical protein